MLSLPQIFIVSLLTIVTVIGIPGNSLIIAVYANKPRKTSAHIFILALGFTDLFVCTILPTLMYTVIHAFNGNRALCLFQHYSSAYGVHLSFILSGIIAIDRYLMVSQPSKRKITAGNAKLTVMLALIVSCIMTVPTVIITDIIDLKYYTFTFRSCNSDPRSAVEKAITMIKFVLMLSIVFTVGILYVKLYRIVKQSRVRVHDANGLQQVQQQVQQDDTTLNTLSVRIQQAPIPGAAAERGTDTDSDPTSTDDRPPGSSIGTTNRLATHQQQRSGLRNRTTLMLLVVTSVMFLSWIPPTVIGISSIIKWDGPQQSFLLMTNGERMTSIFFQMLFSVNHGANAIIYGAVNKHFRQDCYALLRKLSIQCNQT